MSSRAVFEEFWAFADRNKDGKLDKTELKLALKTWKPANAPKGYTPPNDREMDNMFLAVDSNNDNVITKEEYIDEMCLKPKRRAALEAKFKALDKDKNGTLSVDEILELVMECPDFKDDANVRRIAESMVEQCDKDTDGKISMEEFVAVCNTI